MAWQLLFSLFIVSLIVCLLVSIPVAFAFLILNIAAATLIIGFPAGGLQVTGSIAPTIMNFSLLPIPLFVFMGELLFHSGLASRTLDAVGKWFGRIPGRLSLVTQAAGASFSVFSGSSLATTSMLGTLMVPEMRKRGYSVEMSAGAILAAGGLAMVIPPSAIAVLVGTIGHISIGRLLLAGLLPGLLLAVIAMGYIVIRCAINPSLAPAYDIERISWGERFRVLLFDILPLSSVLIVVMGLIISGIGTPTEAAAVGSVAAAILIACYRKLTLTTVRKALMGTVRIGAGILIIIAGAAGFSQLVAFSGAVRGLLEVVSNLNVSPKLIVVMMLLVLLILGSPLEHISIMLITLPVFVPIVIGLGLDPVWFGILFMLMLDIAGLTPPMGLSLFVMDSVTPPDVDFYAIVKSALPFIGVDVVVIILLFIWPEIATFIPDLVFGGR